MLSLDIGLFQSMVEMQCSILSILFTMCQYLFGIYDRCVEAVRPE
jgi:hypothetical protein